MSILNNPMLIQRSLGLHKIDIFIWRKSKEKKRKDWRKAEKKAARVASLQRDKALLTRRTAYSCNACQFR
ncbi:conserved hypothetical protein [Ricinus communis]|uniref:Uncharacterized protein n=1 Tax=Ricinus communis TaxID=3988 RepID=B9S221_RICCO|nr:conserved hypothetical protein [Ricinus communis]